MTEEDLYDMDDDALEAAYKEAKANEVNSEIDDEPTVAEQPDEELVDTDVDDEDEVLDLEQPDEQESDDDADVDDELDENEDEDSETKDAELDEDSSEVEEQAKSEEESKETNTQPVQKHKFKANGMEYEFTEEEIKAQFPTVFGQAMDYTKKMQQIKPWRKTIDAIEQAKLSQDDINLAIDVLKGDKEAIGELLKRTGIDALDLDTENVNYEPKDYGRDEKTLALKDVIEEISVDPEYNVTQRVLTNDWDEASWSMITEDPQMVKALHVDVKTGMYDKVQPIAAKLKVYDGGRKTDLDYYKEAAKVYFAEQSKAEQEVLAAKAKAEEARMAKEAELQRVQAEAAKRDTVKQKAEKRKRAVPTKKGAGTTKGKTDYLDDSDEDFEKWYASLQEKY